jgi:hypothetical protein
LGVEKQIDDLKIALKNLTFSDDLEQDTIDILHKKMDLVRETLNDIGFILQKEAVDEEKVSEITEEVRRQIVDNPLFEGVPTEKISQIADSVIKKSDKHVLTSEDFDEEILQLIRQLSDSELVKTAYTESEVEQVGFGITRGHGPQAKTKGKEVLTDIVKTPIGREEALTKAIERVRSDRDLMLKHLYDYYEINEPEDEEQLESEETGKDDDELP